MGEEGKEIEPGDLVVSQTGMPYRVNWTSEDPRDKKVKVGCSTTYDSSTGNVFNADELILLKKEVFPKQEIEVVWRGEEEMERQRALTEAGPPIRASSRKPVSEQTKMLEKLLENKSVEELKKLLGLEGG